MKNLKVTLVQTSLFWEDSNKNRKHFTALLRRIPKNSTQLIVLPEMFTSGFTMNAADVAETMDGPSVIWMKEMAASKNAVICGSMVINSQKKYFNRLIWASPDGSVSFYDKRHLFRMANEQLTYTGGTARRIFRIGDWRICPLVCYDLRFPVWSRNRNEFDLLLYVANWPKKRSFAWKQLLIARAIENQCYIAGVNRIGTDGKKIPYSGDTAMIGPLGKKLTSIKSGEEAVVTLDLSLDELNVLRNSFPVAMDADDFEILK